MINFKPLSRTLTDTSLIYEFNEPMPDWVVKSGEEYFKQFAFEYGHHAASFNDGQPYFGKMIFLREKGINERCPPLIQNICDCLQLSILKKVDPESRFIELQRIAVNGQTSNQHPCTHIDSDSDPNLWTAVYYVNNSSGDTVFYQSMINQCEVFRSKFQQGKLVLFPASFAHKALAPISGWRISIGITFEWMTALSNFKRDTL